MENTYTNTEILNYMDLNPELSVLEISAELGISSISVSQAQHEKMKIVLAKYRKSENWGIDGYRLDPRPWMNIQQFSDTLAKIEDNQDGVYDDACKDFRIAAGFRSQLKAAVLNV